MTALLCALAALVLFGLGDLVYKYAAAAGTKPHQFLMVQSWFFAPSVFAYAGLTGKLVAVPAVAWGGVAALFALAGFYNFAHSLRKGSLSVNAPIFRLNFILTAALSILFLGEALTAAKVAGIALAVAAAWLLLGGGDAGGERRAGAGSLARVLVATACVGVASFVYKLGLRGGAGPAALVAAQSAVFVPCASALAAWVDGAIKPAPLVWRYAPFAGLLLAAGFSFLLEALARGEASVVVPIAQMGFVVAALVGWMFLRESFSLRKAFGLAAALGALAALASA